VEEDEEEEGDDDTLVSEQLSLKSAKTKREDRDNEATLKQCKIYVHDDLELLPDGQMEALLNSNGVEVAKKLDESVTHVVVGNVEQTPDLPIKRRQKITAKIVDEQWIFDRIHELHHSASASAVEKKEDSQRKGDRRHPEKKQKSKQYGKVHETEGLQSLLAGKEFDQQVSIPEQVIEDLEGGDDFREWDLTAENWNLAKEIKIDKDIKSFVLPYGKYCADIDDPCAWITWKQLAFRYCSELGSPEDVSVYDVYEAVTKFYMENLEKIEDGCFLVGFQVSADGTWLASFEA